VSEAVLEAYDLVKEFRGSTQRRVGKPAPVRAVDGVSLSLQPGRVTALVGESGSGKSTVARLLSGLYPPTAGRVLLDGSAVRVRRGAAFRRYTDDVQLILQDPFSSLNPVHTVRYTLTRALRLHGQPADGLANLLQRVNLTPAEQFADRFPHQLSGGQRQRVAIARALAARPRVLLADEPVSMLDVSIRLGMLRLLARLTEEDNLAVLYITHDIASARYFAADILVMYAGQLIERGPAESVTQHPVHPYTQMLIDAAPDPDRPRGQEAQVPSEATRERSHKHSEATRERSHQHSDVPSLAAPPAGCRFQPRCPLAMPVCVESFPAETQHGTDHVAHCWAYGEKGSA